ncbi:MAG: DUF2589 domain-containing protein [Clostridia bacterium]|nr:DUF2589 domain-containing protein [Clostridia bacterium]
MAKVEKFEDLIGSIQQAFISVNNMAEQQHIESLQAYFDADGKPRCLTMQMPYFDDCGVPQYREMDVPLISIVPVNSLKLAEINVDFKVRLSANVKLSHSKLSNNLMTAKANNSETDGVLGFIPEYKKRDNEGYANIVLKFTSDEPPEGVMKIRDEMIKILP